MNSIEGNTLPKGWVKRKLGEVFKDISSGFACSKRFEKDGGYVHLRTHNISTQGVLNFDKIIQIEESKVNRKSSKIYKGDVIFNNTNSTELVGKTSFVDKDYNYGFSNHLTRIKTSDFSQGKYLTYFLTHLHQQGHFFRICKKWIGQSGVNISMLKDLNYYYPPLEEQKRIVAKIDTLFAKIDKAISLTEESLVQAKNFLPSVLKEVFEKGKADGWEEKKLGDIAFLKSGSTPSRSNNSYWDEGTIPWLKSGELNDVMGIKENSEFITEIALNETSVKLFEKDTLLIAMYGATAGKLGILSINATTNQAVCSIQNKKGMFNNHFMFYFLFSIREQIIGDSFGGAQPNISKTYLETLTLRLPDLSIQEVAVSLCNELSLKAKQTQSKLEEQLAYLKQLKSSILSKAFKGEL